MTEDETQDVLADGIDNRGDENLIAEAEHSADWPEVYSPARMPLAVVVTAYVRDGYEQYLLPGQTPVAETEESQYYAHQPGSYHRHHGYDGLLLILHVAYEISALRNAEGGDEEGEEHKS